MLSGCAHARGARPRADRLCASARRLSRGRPEANAVHQATRWSWRGERASGRRGCTPTARYEAACCVQVCVMAEGGGGHASCRARISSAARCVDCVQVINEIAISFQEIPKTRVGGGSGVEGQKSQERNIKGATRTRAVASAPGAQNLGTRARPHPRRTETPIPTADGASCGSQARRRAPGTDQSELVHIWLAHLPHAPNGAHIPFCPQYTP